MFNRRLVSAYMTHQSKIMMELFQAILSTKPSHLGLNGPRRPRKPSRRWAPDEGGLRERRRHLAQRVGGRLDFTASGQPIQGGEIPGFSIFNQLQRAYTIVSAEYTRRRGY